MSTVRPNKLLDQLIASNTARARKDIQSWRTAMQQAEKVENPNRNLLYSIYDELVLDAHLYSLIQKRTLALQGAEFSIYNPKDGKVDSEKTMLFKKPWFSDFSKMALEGKRFWGHSLVQIEDLVDGEINAVTLVKRRHIAPEKGMFKVRESDDKGIMYREDPKYNDWLLEVGEPFDLGLLNKCAPYILYKRFATAAWSEYCEIFGMPIRIAKTSVKDTESLNRMENMMIQMGTAAYAIIDEDESIQFIETTAGKGEVYQNLIEMCDNQLSKLISGAVTGEASDGGSRSKEEVGERMSELLTKADKEWFESYINYTLIPKLNLHGYKLDNFLFRFEQSKDIAGLWAITKEVLVHYDVAPEFISETFGVPVTAKKQAPEAGKENLSAKDFFLS